MEFLGVGPLEFLFILLIVVLLFSPKDIAKGARSVGRTLNRVYKSENYRILQKTSQELRNLPQRLAREANLDELESQLKNEAQQVSSAVRSTAENPFQAWTPPPAPETENRIAPPSASQSPKSTEASGPDQPSA